MKVNRRSFVQRTAATVAAGMLGSSAWAADEPIGVASIHDLSGGLDIYGKPMVDALTLAVEEANAAGGLLGRQIKLINYDTQSSMQLYTQFAQQAALKDKVAVVHGGITSASREVIRPVLDKFKTLYFYNTQYEGGVCDRNQFDTGVTPAQTVEKLVPYAMKKWGKKVYVVAADYNYGQITSQWVKKYVTENGGEVSSIDFFPLDVTNFGSTISKIQAAKPDFVWSALVGGAHISFYRQWAAAGMRKSIPMASTTFAVGNEHIVLSPDECNGMLVCYNYFQDLKNKTNEAFVERFHKRFGADYPNVTELAMGTYQGFLLWAEGVKKAKQRRPPEGDRGARDRHQHRCAVRQGDDRSADPSLRPRRSHRRGQGQEAQRARRFRAAEAGRHRRGVQSHQEPDRQPAIRDQDLRAGRTSHALGKVNVDLVVLLAIQVLYAIASLALISVGLAIIFGMMRVINLAHGEFLMLGGYAAIVATSHGVSIWIAMLVVAPVVVGLIGVVVERTIIRFLYGRMIDTMLATWGLSLFLVGLTTAIFGNTTVGISAPLGSFQIGAYRTSGYTLFVIAVAVVVLAGIFAVLRLTRLGLIARGTMQNANMAAALGVNPPRVYAVTFGIGAALSGLAGAVLAPVSGVFPTIGVAYVAKSFITVIGGGAAILTGTVSASALFGTINQIATFLTTPVFGEVALLAAAIVLIRLLPQGITGRFFRRGL